MSNNDKILGDLTNVDVQDQTAGLVLTSLGNNLGYDLKVAGSVLPPDRICDADGDTCVEVETSADNDRIIFTTDGAERMRVTNIGRVGIGTAVPNAILDVASRALIAVDTDVESYIGRAAIGSLPAPMTDFASFSHIDHNTASNFCLYQYSNGETSLNAAAGQEINLRIANAKKMTIEAAGVGIGNDAPSQILDVTGNAKVSAQLITGGIQSTLLVGGSAPTVAASGVGVVVMTTGSNDFAGTIILSGTWAVGESITLTYNVAHTGVALPVVHTTFMGTFPGSGQPVLYGALTSSGFGNFVWTSNTATTIFGSVHLNYMVIDLV